MTKAEYFHYLIRHIPKCLRGINNFPDIYEWTLGGTAAWRKRIQIKNKIHRTNNAIWAEYIGEFSTDTYWEFYNFRPLVKYDFDYSLN